MKSHGFYTIFRGAGRADWSTTNSNNRDSHENWFFISGPRISNDSISWEVDPATVVMPDLTLVEANYCITLNKLEVWQFPLSTIHSDDWIFSLWDSGNISFCLSFIWVFYFHLFQSSVYESSFSFILTFVSPCTVSTLQDVIRHPQKKMQTLKNQVIESAEAGGVDATKFEVSGTGH